MAGKGKSEQKGLVSGYLAAVKSAPANQQVLLFFAFAAFLVCLALTGELGLGGHSGYAVCVFIPTLLCVGFVVWQSQHIYGNSLRSEVLATAGESKDDRVVQLGGGAMAVSGQRCTWSRTVLRLPLPDEALRGLREKLDDLPSFAVSKLPKRIRGVTADKFRVNIFVPTYNHPDCDGDPFLLCMPPSLQVNMDGHPDEKLYLRPRQGVTGSVFFTERPWPGRVELAADDADRPRKFKKRFRLDDEKEKLLHPDLRWVISVPLKVYPHGSNAARSTVATLSLDGLGFELNDEELQAMMGSVAQRAIQIAEGSLRSLPQATIMCCYTE